MSDDTGSLVTVVSMSALLMLSVLFVGSATFGVEPPFGFEETMVLMLLNVAALIGGDDQ